MLCQFLLFSKVIQLSTYMYMCVCVCVCVCVYIHTHTHTFFLSILFHHSVPQDISSLCYIGGPWCLSILPIIAYLPTPVFPQGTRGLDLHSDLYFS